MTTVCFHPNGQDQNFCWGHLTYLKHLQIQPGLTCPFKPLPNRKPICCVVQTMAVTLRWSGFGDPTANRLCSRPEAQMMEKSAEMGQFFDEIGCSFWCLTNMRIWEIQHKWFLFCSGGLKPELLPFGKHALQGRISSFDWQMIHTDKLCIRRHQESLDVLVYLICLSYFWVAYLETDIPTYQVITWYYMWYRHIPSLRIRCFTEVDRHRLQE